ncbi:hypothetical protein TrVFT333_006456 [Trichoderma virens FT-333]|nr:hypothetical protein TrVFT333_006456 [Trichoderma virens FT-333]
MQADIAAIVHNLKAVLQGSLEDSDRAPRGFDPAIEALNSPNNTLKIFAESGFWPWYAYSISSIEVKNAVAALPELKQQQIARVISMVTPSKVVQRRVNSGLYRGQSSAKRQKILEQAKVDIPPEIPQSTSDNVPAATDQEIAYPASNNTSIAANPEMIHPTSNSSTVTNQEIAHLMSNNASIAADQDIRHLPTNNTSTVINQEIAYSISNDTSTAANQEITHAASNNAMIFTSQDTTNPMGSDVSYLTNHGLFEWPDARNLPLVFCSNMCESIIKVDAKAQVQLAFADDPSNCHLTVFISGYDIPNIAKEIFNINIRDRNGKWSIVIGDGTTIQLEESLLLTGSDTRELDRIFGSIPSTAFRNSPLRIEEVLNGIQRSKHLSMRIWKDTICYAQIELKADAGGLTSMRDALFYQGGYARGNEM